MHGTAAPPSGSVCRRRLTECRGRAPPRVHDGDEFADTGVREELVIKQSQRGAVREQGTGERESDWDRATQAMTEPCE